MILTLIIGITINKAPIFFQCNDTVWIAVWFATSFLRINHLRGHANCTLYIDNGKAFHAVCFNILIKRISSKINNLHKYQVIVRRISRNSRWNYKVQYLSMHVSYFYQLFKDEAVICLEKLVIYIHIRPMFACPLIYI